MKKIYSISLNTLSRHDNHIYMLSNLMTNELNESLTLIKQRLQGYKSKLQIHSSNAIQDTNNKISKYETMLVAKDPFPWIIKGWTQLYSEQGLIKKAKDVQPNTSVKARLFDAQLEMKISEITPRNPMIANKSDKQ